MIYQLFGVNLISDFTFTGELCIGRNETNEEACISSLQFFCNRFPPYSVDWGTGKLIYYYPHPTSVGVLWDKLYDFGDFFIWRFAWGADFYIHNERIDCHLRNPANQILVERHLISVIFALWLEQNGLPVLHASAISTDGRIAAFPSHSGNGKSTLASAFLQTGATLLTDDILPVEHIKNKYWGLSGLPQINMWPDQIAHFTAPDEDFESVFPGIPKRLVPINAVGHGVFCKSKQPLTCIYIPDKYDTQPDKSAVEITPIPPAESVIELVRHSFIGSCIFERLGWQAGRLSFFSQMTRRVHIRRLRYPVGFEYLPQVTSAILRDMDNLPSLV
ncbi:MAG: hypothetical protein HZB50_07680 [Chloroflexi bacterium]|nr:hypothetical protein [Chloroflexota bacterium]